MTDEKKSELAKNFDQALNDFLRVRCQFLTGAERSVIESEMGDAFRLGTTWMAEFTLKVLADAVNAQRTMTANTLRLAMLATADSVATVQKAALDRTPEIKH